MEKTIKHKKVKGKITTLKALLYKDCMAYVRMIGESMFEWLIVFEGKIFSSYLIMKPKAGSTKLSDDEIAQTRELIWAGATSTIDTLLGETLDTKKDKLSKEKQKVVKAFQTNGKVIKE